ncbi:calcium channel flower [Galendromus occidentalis]|uniref:Calcium channel flower n=1 Tax=Galendromus occidentalis TaxID=34638 RepID=A0AAJ6QQD8_9ACAR|nr:calcium channel flower [Galendromus occidentalis]XP_018493985.1 calcium channel flower [Galendromus occidentalis]
MNADFMKKVPREALPNAEEMNATDSVPWYLRYGARVLATIGGVLSIVLGILGCFVSILVLYGKSVLAGGLEAGGGCIVLLIEAPFLFAYVAFSQKPREWLEKQNNTPFFKAILLITIGLVPLLISTNLNTIFGSGLVLMAGVFYAVIGFGRKAPREQMAAAATGQSPSAMEQGRPPVY